ncbi:MAG: hypothetical protein BGO37_12900 [Cellulomonas sp. 73-92]|uniref:heavy-metal-associated domain-containing protein n=1 Tax=Cellulomonas sp. 73-92 TaxID=1895740 RepID=UPI00092CA340|nr:heavy metal transporter [Cellulomonas sp. 73-92]OJV78728.1 MAG: hypothetical protein BGO37_12900 [Cellulomonas sp. 73-92]
MSSRAFAVAGLACGTCLAELMDAVRAVPGVIGVGVTLVHGAPSALTVTALGPVPTEQIAAAVTKVGFTFAPLDAPVPDTPGVAATRTLPPSH